MTRPLFPPLPPPLALLIALMTAGPVLADALVPLRTIPARALIGPEDVGRSDATVPGALVDPALVVGLEARIALYPGRPIRAGDVGPPAVVERNQIVPLVYQSGALTISVEGRALDRAGPGEMIRVMNLSSRATVTARVGSDGVAYVPG